MTRRGSTEAVVRKAKRRFWLHQSCGTTTAQRQLVPFSPKLPLPSASQSGAGAAQVSKRTGSDPPCARRLEPCGDAVTAVWVDEMQGSAGWWRMLKFNARHIPQLTGQHYHRRRGGLITPASTDTAASEIPRLSFILHHLHHRSLLL
jgi:hypothetical protein